MIFDRHRAWSEPAGRRSEPFPDIRVMGWLAIVQTAAQFDFCTVTTTPWRVARGTRVAGLRAKRLRYHGGHADQPRRSNDHLSTVRGRGRIARNAMFGVRPRARFE